MKKLRRIPFTNEGFEELKKQYQKIKEGRGEAVKTLQAARELGDLSENGLYKAARARLSSIDHSLRRLDTLIKLAEVTESTSEEFVSLSSYVTLNDGKKVSVYQIVGEYEADPINGKISNVSPIGEALINKKVGNVVIINIPSGKIVYKIEKISNKK